MKKIIGSFQSCFSLKSSIIGGLFLALAVLVITVTLTAAKYEVQFDDNGKIFNFEVYSRSVRDALSEADIRLGEYDELSCSLDDEVRNYKVISVKRAKAVNLAVGGESTRIYTTLSTVEELIAEKRIPLGNENLLLMPLSSPIEEDMTVEIIPKNYEEYVETAEIPFGIVEKASYNMDRGSTRVVQTGESGLKRIVYKVLKHNGEILDKVKVGENVVKNPVSRIVEYGTIATAKTSRGDTFRYSRVITATASAYCIKGRTATGMQTSRGVVAVDPSVIPLGSRLYIQTENGRYIYGYAVAADTGGGVRGNRVDLYMDTRSECLSFGLRTVNVYVLE